MTPELTELCGKLRDELISAEEFDRLQEILKSDPEAIEYYLEHMTLTAIMEQELAGLQPQPALSKADSSQGSTSSPVAQEEPPPPKSSVLPTSPIPPTSTGGLLQQPLFLSVSIASAVIAMIVLVMAFVVPPFTGGSSEAHRLPGFAEGTSAKITGVSDVVWTADATIDSLDVSAPLAPGSRVTLESGFVELTFASGVTALLEGPADFVVVSDNSGELIEGSLHANVPAAAIGYSVFTKQCKATDLGTRFGMRASAETSELHVLEGLVAVEAGSLRKELSKGESVVIGNDGIILAIAPREFRDTMPPGPLVAAITWQPVADMTGPEDILNEGTVVTAINGGGDAATVNGVSFEPGHLDRRVGGNALYRHTSGDPELDKVLSTNTGGKGDHDTLVLSGLKPETRYRVQIIYCDGRPRQANQPTVIHDGRPHQAVSLNNNPVLFDQVPPFGQFVVGEFVAKDYIQPIIVSSERKRVHITAWVVCELPNE